MSKEASSIMYCPECKSNVATRREDINLFLAFVLVIFTSGIGLLIYLFVYYEREPNHCIHCMSVCVPLVTGTTEQTVVPVLQVHPINPDTHYCFNCGTGIERKETKFCPLCGVLIE